MYFLSALSAIKGFSQRLKKKLRTLILPVCFFATGILFVNGYYTTMPGNVGSFIGRINVSTSIYLSIAMHYKLFNVSIIFFLTVFVANCQEKNIASVEFNAIARGGYNERIIVTHDSIRAIKTEQRAGDSTVYTRKLSAKEWGTIMDSLAAVSLEDIPGLQSPTMHRAYDGATHSSLVITRKDGGTWSHAFDDENPSKELMPLMKAVREAAKRTVVDK